MSQQQLEEKQVLIKSSRVSLKENNKCKLDNLYIFLSQYRRVAEQLVKALWCKYGFQNNLDNKPDKFIDTQLFKQFNIQTWLGARVIQNIGKQVLGIIKGTIKKQKQRLYMVKQLNKEGKFKQARKLQRVIDKQSISCPDCTQIQPQLSERCYKNLTIKEDEHLSWITICSLKSNKYKGRQDLPDHINLCFNLNKHFNKLKAKAVNMKHSILLSNNNIQFIFQLEPQQNQNINTGKKVGVDVGVNCVYSCSNGLSQFPDEHGHTYKSILQKLSRQKKGSKNFIQTSKQRTQYLQWLVKRLHIEDNQVLVRENIKDMYRGKNTKRILKHFNYRLIFDILNNYCKEHGVRVVTVNQRYTSQRCSVCGYVHKRNRSNRKFEEFKCRNCGSTLNADQNAARNISLQLKPLSKKQCKGHLNRTGFFWDLQNIFK